LSDKIGEVFVWRGKSSGFAFLCYFVPFCSNSSAFNFNGSDQLNTQFPTAIRGFYLSCADVTTNRVLSKLRSRFTAEIK
jgi:hypothetical protein